MKDLENYIQLFRQYFLNKNRLLVLTILFGYTGIDRFVLGYKFWWVKTITIGGFWICYWYDVITLASGSLKKADGTEIPD